MRAALAAGTARLVGAGNATVGRIAAEMHASDGSALVTVSPSARHNLLRCRANLDQ